jgi:hypothetical protein
MGPSVLATLILLGFKALGVKTETKEANEEPRTVFYHLQGPFVNFWKALDPTNPTQTRLIAAYLIALFRPRLKQLLV